MKLTPIILASLLGTLVGHAGIGEARDAMRRGKPEKASDILWELLEKNPNDPWLIYNAGVAAYAARNYEKAEAIWQRLASMQIPAELSEQVWMQIGNVSFRLAEPALESRPETTIAKLEQGREAYRIASARSAQSDIASKNLKFVEGQLENVYVRLSAKLVEAAKKEKLPEDAIEKLYPALEHQRSAKKLNPAEPKHAAAEHDIQRAIAQKFVEKAETSEKRGDRLASEKTLDEKQVTEAKTEFENAIADLKQAQGFDPGNQTAKQGEDRVQGKLASMFTKAGRQQQRQGNAEVKRDPAKALVNFDDAIAHFESALAVKPDYEEALKGKEEVQQAMEKLHIAEGDKLVKAGEAQLKKDAAGAVEDLLGALDHYEQAKAINQENPEIPPRIEHVRRLLPDALVALGRRDQQRAEEAEPSSIRSAIGHPEKAEAAYERALGFDPGHVEAQQGLQEVREDLARLRKQLEDEEPAGLPEPQQTSTDAEKGSPEAQETLESMLADLKAKQKEGEGRVRLLQREATDTSEVPGFRDW